MDPGGAITPPLKLYEERDIVGHVRAVAPAFLAGLAAFADHPLLGDVRGADGNQRAAGGGGVGLEARKYAMVRS